MIHTQVGHQQLGPVAAASNQVPAQPKDHPPSPNQLIELRHTRPDYSAASDN